MPEFLYLFRNFVKHQIVSEKIFFREICGGLFSDFETKKFGLKRIDFRKKKKRPQKRTLIFYR